MSDPDCLFCNVIARKIPSSLVYEDDDVLAFEDIHPQAPVHVLIIPKVHIPTVADLSQPQVALMGKMIQVANQIAKAKHLESGYRLVVNCQADAGQVIYHLHLHLLGGRKFSWPPG